MRTSITTSFVVIMVVAVLFEAITYESAQSVITPNSAVDTIALFKSGDAEIGDCVVVSRDDTSGVERGFISVSIPPAGDTLVIDRAELILTVAPELAPADPLFIVAAPAQIEPSNRPSAWLQSWDPTSGGFDLEYLAMIPVVASQAEVEVRIDVTELVRRWEAGESPNYGFVLKSLSESKSAFSWIRDGRYSGQDAKLEVWYSRM